MSRASDLRLSAVRAFLGRIHPEMRLIKARRDGEWITVYVVFDREPAERVRDDVLDATTEIISDFTSPMKIRERLEISTAPLQTEDIFAEGWIYRRAE